MRRKTRKSVGLLGLGIIGSRAAASLRAAGYQVYVWNRTPRPAPNFLSTPGEVAELCDVIQIFVADARAVMDVLEAIAPKLKPEHTVICSATIGPEATLDAAKFVEEKGARFLDAPFTGSKVAAERAQLVYYVGGDDATFLPVRPVLEATSKAVVRIGAIGDAALIKIVTNQIAAVSIQVLAEALATVRKAGLPTEALAAALEHNGCRSGAMDLKLPKMISGDYQAHFSLKHMFKDVQLGVHLANMLELETPATAVTAGVMFGALKRGWGELDFSSIFQLYDASDSPLEVESTPAALTGAVTEPALELPPPSASPAAAPVEPDAVGQVPASSPRHPTGEPVAVAASDSLAVAPAETVATPPGPEAEEARSA